MITKQNISGYIDAYFRHELSAEEEASLMESLENEPQWKAEFEDQQQLYSSIAAMGQLNIRDRIKADIASGKAYKGSNTKYYYLISAGLLITIGTVAFFNFSVEDKKETIVSVEKNTDSKQQEAAKSEGAKKMAPLHQEKKALLPSPEQLSASDSNPFSPSTDSLDIAVNAMEEKKDPLVNGIAPEEKTITAKDGCKEIKIDFQLKAMSTCAGEATGSIALFGIKGGQSPYKHEVTDDNLQLSGLSGLKNGVYLVKVTDEKGCSGEQYVMVEEKNCPKSQLKLLFRTDVQEYVSIPVAGNKGILQLFDQQNNMVFAKDIPSGTNTYKFDGYTDKGKLTQGVYLLEIKYIGGQETKGYLTIY